MMMQKISGMVKSVRYTVFSSLLLVLITPTPTQAAPPPTHQAPSLSIELRTTLEHLLERLAQSKSFSYNAEAIERFDTLITQLNVIYQQVENRAISHEKALALYEEVITLLESTHPPSAQLMVRQFTPPLALRLVEGQAGKQTANAVHDSLAHAINLFSLNNAADLVDPVTNKDIATRVVFKTVIQLFSYLAYAHAARDRLQELAPPACAHGDPALAPLQDFPTVAKAMVDTQGGRRRERERRESTLDPKLKKQLKSDLLPTSIVLSCATALCNYVVNETVKNANATMKQQLTEVILVRLISYGIASMCVHDERARALVQPTLWSLSFELVSTIAIARFFAKPKKKTEKRLLDGIALASYFCKPTSIDLSDRVVDGLINAALSELPPLVINSLKLPASIQGKNRKRLLTKMIQIALKGSKDGIALQGT